MAHKICKALTIYKLELDQKKLQDSLNFASLGNVSVTLLLALFHSDIAKVSSYGGNAKLKGKKNFERINGANEVLF